MKASELLHNTLMRELIGIRIDTMWRMMSLLQDGRLPAATAEGATGHLDNKGAIFVPGGLVFRDSDRKVLACDEAEPLDAETFRVRIRDAMRFDNATLMYQNGLVHGVNLDNGFFAETAGGILTNKQAALKRRPPFEARPPRRIDAEQITRSHCPTFVPSPYGSRTRLSSCLAVCLVEARMYFIACRNELGLRSEADEPAIWESIRDARKPIVSAQNEALAPPCVVVCHSTRYHERNLGGITRLLGYGKFGEFACLTLERVTGALLNECELADKPLADKYVVAEAGNVKVAAVLRSYPPTQAGRRQKRSVTQLLAPAEDLGIRLDQLAEEARERYRIDRAAVLSPAAERVQEKYAKPAPTDGSP